MMGHQANFDSILSLLLFKLEMIDFRICNKVSIYMISNSWKSHMAATLQGFTAKSVLLPFHNQPLKGIKHNNLFWF